LPSNRIGHNGSRSLRCGSSTSQMSSMLQPGLSKKSFKISNKENSKAFD
jgi:hypothetical protein